MRRNRQLPVKKLLLLFVSLIITILVAEFLLRITYPLYANYNTEMGRYAKEIKVIRNEQYFEHHSNKTGGYYGVEIKTNSVGWREDRDYSLEKPHGVKRIIVLGDSITLGWGVELNQTYPKIFEQLLNNDPSLRYRYEVINTGVGNYNTFLELEMLKRILSYDPDMIILTYMKPDDWIEQSFAKRLGWEGVSAIKKKRVYADINPDIILRPGPRVVKGLIELHKRFYED